MSALLLTTALAASWIAPIQAERVFTTKLPADFSTKMTVEATMDIQGNAVKLAATALFKTTKSENEIAQEVEVAWSEFKITVGTDPFPFPETASSTLFFNSLGEMSSVKSDVPSIDSKSMFSVLIFQAPKEALKEKTAVKWMTTGLNKGSAPNLDRTTTWLGMEKVGEVNAYKVESKMKEKLGTMNATVTHWLNENGTPIKVEGKFVGLSLPENGTFADGTVTATFAKP